MQMLRRMLANQNYPYNQSPLECLISGNGKSIIKKYKIHVLYFAQGNTKSFTE
jgi:hypothetical protein